MEKFLELAQSLYPNMPPDILQLFAEEWSKTGDEETETKTNNNMEVPF